MFYTTSLSRFLDDTFLYANRQVTNSGCVYDFIKNDNGVTKIQVVVPGYDKEELKLEVFGDILKLYCETKDKTFVRKWSLDSSVDVSKIKGECKNGILTISLPKSDDGKKVKTISID